MPKSTAIRSDALLTPYASPFLQGCVHHCLTPRLSDFARSSECADLGEGIGTQSSASVASTASIDSAYGWGGKESVNTPVGPPEEANCRTPRSDDGRSLSSSSRTDSSAGSLDGAEITDDTFMQLVMMNGTAAVPAESTCVNGGNLAANKFDMDDAARLRFLFHTGGDELHRRPIHFFGCARVALVCH